MIRDRLRLPLHVLGSLRHDTGVRDDAVSRDFAVLPMGRREAVAAALA